MQKEERKQSFFPFLHLKSGITVYLILTLILCISILLKFGGKFFRRQGKNFSPPASTIIFPKQIIDSPVVFGKEGKVFLLKNLYSKPFFIDEGNSPNLSSDHSKVAYIKMDKDNNIYIYSISTSERKVIPTHQWRLRGIRWSPNNRYLLAESGTGCIGEDSIFTYPEGKKVISFSVFGGVKWINSNKLIFGEPQRVVPPRPYGNGSGRGLAEIELPSGRKKEVVLATALKDFSLLRVSDNLIYFSESVVKSNSDWERLDRQKEVYWQMDIKNNIKKRIKNRPKTLNEKVAGLLPSKLSEYSIYGAVPHSKFTSWVVFEVRKDFSSKDSNIYIMNVRNPAKTLKRIIAGMHPSW